ncbi:COX15/CtaA family protein [Calycomorphotria hydatis]|uniref:Heme A synthase n=1 Tax=Calycomorphotria hydatis TaxID=2528027 RepID=A0A517TCQ2_9PLAN|nr:COX15/CtaA family protein [Calycomorphotria hydatis]QDT66147.1 Heme A synthase [Calycomorphotria hydatis]
MQYRRANFWLAVFTATLSLTPIIMGALVTTLDAGMAFLDWPTSDGENMLLYNMLLDIREGRQDKVLEHGHRLAGAFLGLVTIGLAATLWFRESRPWVRWLGVAILLGVIIQGLLGGFRVRLDERFLAMTHGAFGAVVFAAFVVVAMVTSKSWINFRSPTPDDRPRGLLPMVTALPFLILLQYSLGGVVRHLGSALFEHVGVAVIVLVFTMVTAAGALWSGERYLRGPAVMLLLIVAAQFGLGVAAWIVKYGFPPNGYVAVYGSPAQVLFRSGHTVVGMALLATSVCLWAKSMHAVSLGWKVRPLKPQHGTSQLIAADMPEADSALNQVKPSSPEPVLTGGVS